MPRYALNNYMLNIDNDIRDIWDFILFFRIHFVFIYIFISIIKLNRVNFKKKLYK